MFRSGGPIVKMKTGVLVVAGAATLLSVLAQAQIGLKVSDSVNGAPVCIYPLIGGGSRILKVGESVKDTGYASDVAGRVVNITIVATCWQAKESLAIELATTLDGQPVAIYNTKRNQTSASVALRAGESVQDAVYAFTADKKLTDIPVSITCRDRDGLLYLEMTATLGGKPAEFYADAENIWYVLKPGENIPGTRRVEVKKGWDIRGLHVPIIDRPKRQ
jgi:hypothetical protein